MACINIEEEEKMLAGPTPPEMNPDFLVIRIVGRIVISVIKQCWAISSAMFVSVVLFYWMFGGISAFIVLCFSAAGNIYIQPLYCKDIRINFLYLIFSYTGIIYRSSDKLLYYPEVPQNSRIFVPSPNTIGLPFESVYLKSLDSTKLHAYFMPQPEPHKCPTILFFHGNAGNIGHRLPNAKGLFKHLQVNILLLEYRGFGLSEGKVSEGGLYKDAQAGLNYLHTRQDIDHRKIFVFGRSLGKLFFNLYLYC